MSNRAGQGGFTLIETLVATTLLSMISLSFALGAASALRYNAFARSLAVATTLGNAKVEELTEKAATDPQLTAGDHADPTSPLQANGAAGGTYSRSWTVTNDVPVAGLKTIEVQVAWTLYGTPRTVRLVMVHS